MLTPPSPPSCFALRAAQDKSGEFFSAPSKMPSEALAKAGGSVEDLSQRRQAFDETAFAGMAIPDRLKPEAEFLATALFFGERQEI